MSRPVPGFCGGAGKPAWLPPVTIITTGSTFSPSVQVNAANVTVTWTCPAAGITTTGLTPTLNFGSAATRVVYMTATIPGGYSALGQVTLFNIGFSHLDDQGRNSLPASYDWAAQSVGGITGVNSMTGLQKFLAANIAGLTGPVCFDGMSQLTHIECYQSSFTSATVAGCSSMIRLVLESNKLTAFNLNPVAASIQEFRCAFQQGGALALTPLAGGSMPNLYHFCVRDQTVTGMPPFSSGFGQLTQLWIWNTGQSGTLQTNSTVPMDSILAHDNAYTTLNAASQFPYTSGQFTGQIAMANCALTSATITGDGLLYSVDFRNNLLSQAQVDSVLTTMNGYGSTNAQGLIDVSGTGNAAPSGTGVAAATALRGRSWTVNTN